MADAEDDDDCYADEDTDKKPPAYFGLLGIVFQPMLHDDIANRESNGRSDAEQTDIFLDEDGQNIFQLRSVYFADCNFLAALFTSKCHQRIDGEDGDEYAN